MNESELTNAIAAAEHERDETGSQIGEFMSLGLGDPARKEIGALRRRYGRAHGRIERLYGRLHRGPLPGEAGQLVAERDRLLARIRELSLLYPSDPRTCELAPLRARWARSDRKVRGLVGD